MHRSLPLLVLTVALGTPPVMAQTGRTMRLLAPAVLGQTLAMTMLYPPSIAGHPYALAMCSPSYPFALTVTDPGIADGVLRLDPSSYGVLTLGVLDASGQSPALTFPVPNDLLLVGASFDVQGADAGPTGFVSLTDNELEVAVAAPPPAGLNMVGITPGTFQMGSVAVGGTALPVHPVTITRPFWIGKYEVTQAEYQAVMGSNPSYHQGANRPVELVSWGSAVAYCDALTVQEAAAGRLLPGYEYRLPTEAEWEYCCRAGTTTEWNVGSSLDCGQANVGGCGVGQTTVVGTYAANAWGLHDTHGNEWEWCSDTTSLFGGDPPGDAVSDPVVTSGIFRVFRGGSYFLSNDSLAARSANRGGNTPGFTASLVGFRVVCAPVLP